MAYTLPSLSLVIQSGPTVGQTFTVGPQPKTIGRGGGSDIIITDPTISRLHARIKPTPQGYLIEDLSGRNNTLVNNRLVTDAVLLRPGDILRLGPNVVIQVQAAPAAPGSAGSDETWMPRTTLAPGETSRTVIPLGGYNPPLMPDRTVMPAAPNYTVGPGPVAPAPPVSRNTKAWIIMGVVVGLTALLVAGFLGYIYLTRTTPAADEVAAAPATATPPPPPTPTPTTAAPPTTVVIKVPGVALAAAPEQPIPREVVNLVNPFCNQQVEIKADEPVVIVWQQRLAEPDGEIDYVTQWLASAHYDLTLAGRPLTSFNYERGAGPALNMWANLGLLPAGKHYLRIQQFTSRPLSTGLDLDPTDGQVDTYPAGPISEGFCEILVPEPTAAPTATPTMTPTPLPSPTAEPTKPAATPTVQVAPPTVQAATPTVQAVAPPVQAAAPGIFQDFESNTAWKRGDQPYGEFTRSSGQVHSGSYAGQLSYNFPSPDNDYVVFRQSRALGGRPNGLSAWVYGDGSSHFLNVWIKDSGGQTWQMSFGPVKHTGWKEMTAFIDPGQPWPSGSIDGPNNGAIEYPISFQALVLDDNPDSYRGNGTIYLDDLSSKEGAASPTPTPQPQAAAPAPVAPSQPVAPAAPAPAVSSAFTLRLGGQHRYEEPWGAPGPDGPCRSWERGDWDDRNANFRGFNVELLLTNNSTTKITDAWGEGLTFRTASGQEVMACYFGYGGAGPVPGGTTSVTFFSVMPKGDFVQVIELNLNGQTARLCLDGRGGAAGC